MNAPEAIDVAETLRRHPDAFSGGARLIPVQTAYGTFNVWTKRIGNNPRLKVLLLHGGPGCTHEYFEAFDSYLPRAGVEYYYYDQLGSLYSDQPDVPELWELPRFVDEVEQVRLALGLDEGQLLPSRPLLGRASSPSSTRCSTSENLKGLVISNMMSSIPAYNEYAHKVLMPAMDPAVLAGDPGDREDARSTSLRATWSCSSRSLLDRAFPAPAVRRVARPA